MLPWPAPPAADGYAAISAVPERGLEPAASYQDHQTLSLFCGGYVRDGWKLFVQGYSKYVYARDLEGLHQFTLLCIWPFPFFLGALGW